MAAAMATERLPFQPGDPVPWFAARSNVNSRYHFESAAGRYLVLCFFGSAAQGPGKAALELVAAHRDLFDDDRVRFFGVSVDPDDERTGRTSVLLPNARIFWDFDGAISRLCGALGQGVAPEHRIESYRPFWLVLDPQLRVLDRFALPAGDAMIHFIAGLPPVAEHAGWEVPAPVLVLPRVFESSFCRRLIELYEARGGRESGFMREIDGKTVALLNPGIKRRFDYEIAEDDVRSEIRERLARRLVPEIARAFQFRATRIERYIVACYDSHDSGFFSAHRDNTTKGTAHRRFAVTINLNADEYEGGDLRLPEFGTRSYRAPTGGAIVFSCSLLHEALPVTRGRRYACLPFLYDDAAVEVREANRKFIVGRPPTAPATPAKQS